MTIANPVVKPVSQLELAPGSVATLRDVTWPEFEAILEELGKRRNSRIAYSEGILEIMVPLPEHERAKILIADLVKQCCDRSSATGNPSARPHSNAKRQRE